MRKNICLFVSFLAAALFLFLFLIHAIPLWSSDEGRFADIARMMLSSNNWIVPFFNGLPYLEKPVLAVWTTTFSFKFLGLNSLAARLPGIFCALGTLGIVFLFTKRLFNFRAAALSAVCLLTSAGFVLVGRFAVIDMQMIFFLSSALFFIMTAIFEQRPSHYLISCVLMALTFLTKGLIGAVLPVLIFTLFAVMTQNLREFKKINFVLASLIFAAITLPWLVMITHQQPEFLKVFIFEHHFQRFATATFGRKRPFWFFMYILPIISFPWTLFIPAAIAEAFRSKTEQKNRLLFLFCWIAVIFVFFSIPRSKLPYYIVPTTIPLSVLVGTLLAKWSSGEKLGIADNWLTWTWKIVCAVLVLGAAALGGCLFFADKVPEINLVAPLLPWAALTLGLGGVISFHFYKNNSRTTAIATIAGTIYFILIIILFCMLRLSPQQSVFEFAQILKQQASKEDMIAVYASPDRFSDLPFYLERRIVIAGSGRGTLERESREADHLENSKNWFYELSDFVNLMKKDPRRIFCLMEKDRLKEMTELGLGYFKIWRESYDRILISNY